MSNKVDRMPEEVHIEEIEVPDCFTFYDRQDPSCRRCGTRLLCNQAMEENRPQCFGGGLLDEGTPSCMACLHASQCAEEVHRNREESKVAKVKIKRTRRRTRMPRVEAAPEPEFDVEEETKAFEEVPEADTDYASWNVVELREELEERGLDVKGRKSVLIAALLADDLGEEPAEVEKPEPAPSRRRVKEVAVEQAEGSLSDILSAFAAGHSVTVTRTGDDTWLFSPAGSPVASTPAVRRGRGVSGKDYEDIVYSEEFKEFYYHDSGGGKAWKDMTPEERYAYADEVGAEWDEHENTKTDQMRMGQAVREELGIEKYGEDYRTRSARKAVREGAA